MGAGVANEGVILTRRRGGAEKDAEKRRERAEAETAETAEIFGRFAGGFVSGATGLGFQEVAEGFEFGVAAVVAGGGDQGFGFEEVVAPREMKKWGLSAMDRTIYHVATLGGA
jgi:hypothetical protein